MKAVIFDMDGVLFDTERLGIEAWDYAGKKMNIEKTEDMVFKALGMNVKTVNKMLKEEYGKDFDIELFRKYCDEYVDEFISKNKVPVKKGLYNILNYLKENNFKTAIASSSNKNTILRNLKSADIIDFFDIIVSGDMVEKSKPEPDIYEKAAELLDLSPAECYAIEDSRNGLLSAQGAGCKTIMVPDLWQGDKETDSFIIAKCKDLDEAIEFISI
ncbi:MAG: HAD family phosphatase [Eubacterium sp.]|nr:HAD family phosphatase [Eubacterium sp.]